MMSYDKYERGRQHLNGGHQRITYKKKKKKGKKKGEYLPYGLPKVFKHLNISYEHVKKFINIQCNFTYSTTENSGLSN